VRLDQLLCDRGHFPSRERAKRAVMAGLVRVDGRVLDKPGAPVKESASLEVAPPARAYASRGGEKLAGALAAFGLDPEGGDCLDVGASTGGFTDCLLQHGARRVVAVDVGYGLLDDRLRRDERVVVLERVNARYLGPEDLPGPFDLITVDVSFISLQKVVPALLGHLRPGGALLVLVKPQFEAGRSQVGKGGVVRDEAVRRQAIDRCVAALAELGLELVGVSDSVLAGAKGNREAFALLRKPGAGVDAEPSSVRVAGACAADVGAGGADRSRAALRSPGDGDDRAPAPSSSADDGTLHRGSSAGGSRR
jgi:23S rRNA (cytidine1920-2'-O)/16S rRNA (cytidine1409-2'-O)-methyltransferase